MSPCLNLYVQGNAAAPFYISSFSVELIDGSAHPVIMGDKRWNIGREQ